jgi:hypothetical protein
MSNNPFLKSNKNDNRFKFLNDNDDDNEDDTKTSSFKVSSIKKNIEHNSNSFTQSQKQNSSKEQDKNNNRRNNDFTNFKSRDTSLITQTISLEFNNTNLFPELTPITASAHVSSTKFKDMLNTVIEAPTHRQTVPPGWVKISKQNNQIIYNYRPSITYLKKIQKKEEDEPDYVMNTIIRSIKKNWDRYKREYDEINGEGEYAERFSLSPVYFHTESENEHTDDVYSNN